MREIGKPMLVNLPGAESDYIPSGEGGLAFFFVVPQRVAFNKRRQVCIAGEIMWPEQNVQLGDGDISGVGVDAAMLIGSTRNALYSEFNGAYFHAEKKDLTQGGLRLYNTLKRLYGDVRIITLLDT